MWLPGMLQSHAEDCSAIGFSFYLLLIDRKSLQFVFTGEAFDKRPKIKIEDYIKKGNLSKMEVFVTEHKYQRNIIQLQ